MFWLYSQPRWRKKFIFQSTSVQRGNLILVLNISFRSVSELPNILKTFGSLENNFSCLRVWFMLALRFKMVKCSELLNTFGTLLQLHKNVDTYILVIVITKAAPAFFYFCWLKTIILNVIVWTKILYFLLAISLILFK